ncbi:type III secretion system export apparatus subunit SctU [Prosthecobacter vanneervenii]|uniref:Type III secretion protein U n=1 Tax=Prosthecobacter vanneervenii TaxID=48466 RepID=A0A7W8DIM5_9BACT|nr:type III secretion system export apparatus subunit SctU [Prosthecobacter vanneervenii]MBB5031217.1 type III secretion protein U [Prosthecobacter vanneervenii]
MSEKTEDPTPKKLRDARQKGQVAKSQDVTTAALTVASFVLISALWPWYVEQLKALMLLPTAFTGQPFEDVVDQVMKAIAMKILLLSAPMLAIVVVIGIGSNLAQVGFMLVFEPVKPELKKLNPLDKLKQMFSVKNLVEFLKSAAKVIIIAVLIYIVTKNSLDPLTRVPYAGETGVLLALKPMLSTLAINVTLVYIALAAVDYFFQKFQHIKQLKMSKDEVKREYKESEGNPEIKGKRKQLHQEMVMNDTMERTRGASVLVTNPTHLAIAIYYKEEDNQMPRVLAKGEDYVAKRMIEVARQEGIPVMQHIPLARAIYEKVDIDRFIPADLIEPMAEVLRWLKEFHDQQH